MYSKNAHVVETLAMFLNYLNWVNSNGHDDVIKNVEVDRLTELVVITLEGHMGETNTLHIRLNNGVLTIRTEDEEDVLDLLWSLRDEYGITKEDIKYFKTGKR